MSSNSCYSVKTKDVEIKNTQAYIDIQLSRPQFRKENSSCMGNVRAEKI